MSTSRVVLVTERSRPIGGGIYMRSDGEHGREPPKRRCDR